MNIARLQHLIALLRDIPDENFDIRFWYNNFDSSALPDNNDDDDVNVLKANRATQVVTCDTTACALGWAALDPQFNREGLVPLIHNGELIPHFKDTGGEGVHAAAKFFDITVADALRLFGGEYRRAIDECRPTTADDVVDAVEYLIEHGTAPDWSYV